MKDECETRTLTKPSFVSRSHRSVTINVPQPSNERRPIANMAMARLRAFSFEGSKEEMSTSTSSGCTSGMRL